MTEATQPRPRGRPKLPQGRKQYDPPRNAGRIGPLWDECAEQAKADGETMTAFVTKAITRELAVRRRREARANTTAT